MGGDVGCRGGVSRGAGGGPGLGSISLAGGGVSGERGGAGLASSSSLRAPRHAQLRWLSEAEHLSASPARSAIVHARRSQRPTTPMTRGRDHPLAPPVLASEVFPFSAELGSVAVEDVGPSLLRAKCLTVILGTLTVAGETAMLELYPGTLWPLLVKA